MYAEIPAYILPVAAVRALEIALGLPAAAVPRNDFHFWPSEGDAGDREREGYRMRVP